jgi:hypothetical protein
MSPWTTGTPSITRAAAIEAIKAKAVEQGYKGSFKVHYDGTLVDSPATLPDMVDMSKVTISSVLNQA